MKAPTTDIADLTFEFHHLYDSGAKMLRVIVLGRRLTQTEGRDACAVLKQRALTDGRPLDRVAYVFPDGNEAQIWVHALWLRGLEWWTVIDGVERRLDTDHPPIPVPPAWAEAG